MRVVSRVKRDVSAARLPRRRLGVDGSPYPPAIDYGGVLRPLSGARSRPVRRRAVALSQRGDLVCKARLDALQKLQLVVP